MGYVLKTNNSLFLNGFFIIKNVFHCALYIQYHKDLFILKTFIGIKEFVLISGIYDVW